MILLAIGLDPLAQQLVQLKSDFVFEYDSYADSQDRALISRAPFYSMGETMNHHYQAASGTNDSDYLIATTKIPLSMEGAILNGLSRPPWEVSREARVRCPTSNCTWNQFNTIGVCQRCNDLTSDLKRVDDVQELLLAANDDRFDGYTIPATAFTLPNGHFIANVDSCPPYNGIFADCKDDQPLGIYSDRKFGLTSYGTGNPNKTNSMKDINTLIWSMSVIHPDVEALNKSGLTPGDDGDTDGAIQLWPDIPLKATECALYYCVKTVNARVEGNQLIETITQAEGAELDPESWQRSDEPTDGGEANIPPEDEKNSMEFNLWYSVADYSELRFEFPDNKTEQYYRVSEKSVKSISNHFQGLFLDKWTNDTRSRREMDKKLGKGAVGFNGASFGPSRDDLAMEAEPPSLNGLWSWTKTNISSRFDALSTSMTNEMRRNFDPRRDLSPGQDADEEGELNYYGEVGRSTVLYDIRWPWIALHAAMLLSAITFLVITIINAGAVKTVPLAKSHSLATIRYGHEVGHLLAGTNTVAGIEKIARRTYVQTGQEVDAPGSTDRKTVGNDSYTALTQAAGDIEMQSRRS